MSRTKGNAPVVSATEASGETSQTDKGQVMSDSKEVQVSTQPVFSFGEHEVRVIVRDGNPWFSAADVCTTLGIKNHRDSLMHLDDDEKGVVSTDTPGGKQSISVVNESGLYALVLRSRKPEARKFAKWVTGEVLPSIRKTGIYVGKPFSVNPTDTLTLEEQNKIRSMLREAAQKLPEEKQAAAMITGWSKLKSHFKVPYREIPRSEFIEAVSIIARHTATWEVIEDKPKRQAVQILIEDGKILRTREIDANSIDINFDDDKSVQEAVRCIPTSRIKRVTEIFTSHALDVMDYQLKQRLEA